MKKIFLLMLAASWLFISCQDDNEQKTGTLVVSVYGLATTTPAIVFTEPFTTELRTDAFGEVQFKNIAKGNYTVYAYVPGKGSGKSVVQLNAPLVETDISMISGLMLEPTLDIRKPLTLQGFAVGETIALEAKVADGLL